MNKFRELFTNRSHKVDKDFIQKILNLMRTQAVSYLAMIDDFVLMSATLMNQEGKLFTKEWVVRWEKYHDEIMLEMYTVRDFQNPLLSFSNTDEADKLFQIFLPLDQMNELLLSRIYSDLSMNQSVLHDNEIFIDHTRLKKETSRYYLSDNTYDSYTFNDGEYIVTETPVLSIEDAVLEGITLQYDQGFFNLDKFDCIEAEREVIKYESYRNFHLSKKRVFSLYKKGVLIRHFWGPLRHYAMLDFLKESTQGI